MFIIEQTHKKPSTISLVAPKDTTINSGDMPPLVPRIDSDTITADINNPSSYAEAMIKRDKKK